MKKKIENKISTFTFFPQIYLYKQQEIKKKLFILCRLSIKVEERKKIVYYINADYGK